MARRRGDDRRTAVFQWFGAFAASQPAADVARHLGLILDALFRAKVDGQSSDHAHPAAAPHGGAAGGGPAGSDAAAASAEAGPLPVAVLCDEVLALLEHKVGSAAFLAAYGNVQRRFGERRDKRRRLRAAEAVVDPAAAAERRMERSQQKREQDRRRKRAFGELRRAGGSSGKGRKGKGKGKGKGGSAAGRGGLQHKGGGFGRKRPKA